MRNENIERLEEYGRRLVAAGFRVWVTPTSSRSGGYLTYERDGYWGHLQESYFDGWAHDMPIVPSRENGSSMFIGRPVEDVWSVEAAEQVARATNHNNVVGTQRNAGDRTWLSPSSYPIHETPERELMFDLIAEVKGTITLADGSTSEFRIGTDGVWMQWAANTERLGRTGAAMDAMASALAEDNLLVSDYGEEADD